MGVKHGVAVAGVFEKLLYDETGVLCDVKANAGGALTAFFEDELGKRRNDFQLETDGALCNVCESWASLALVAGEILMVSKRGVCGVEGMSLRCCWGRKMLRTARKREQRSGTNARDQYLISGEYH